jgi:hypothetical protein
VARPKLQVDLTGPLFTRDVKKTVRQNIRRMLQGLVEEGERLAQSIWPVLTGAGRDNTEGRVRSLTGKPWFLTGVVSARHVYPWPNGGAKQYRGGKSEQRVGMFRRTATAMRRSRTVISANLVEGLE